MAWRGLAWGGGKCGSRNILSTGHQLILLLIKLHNVNAVLVFCDVCVLRVCFFFFFFFFFFFVFFSRTPRTNTYPQHRTTQRAGTADPRASTSSVRSPSTANPLCKSLFSCPQTWSPQPSRRRRCGRHFVGPSPLPLQPTQPLSTLHPAPLHKGRAAPLLGLLRTVSRGRPSCERRGRTRIKAHTRTLTIKHTRK